MTNFDHYKVVRLVNDHKAYVGRDKLDYDKRESILGWMFKGDDKKLVCVGVVGYDGHLSINDVYRGEEGRLHLSTYARYTLTPSELRNLLNDGSLTFEGEGPRPTVRFEVMKADEELPI